MKESCQYCVIFSFLLAAFFLSCRQSHADSHIRQPVDTIGFAHTARQMDSLMVRVDRIFGHQLDSLDSALYQNQPPWKAAICPHDDYTYVGWLYPGVLKGIRAKTVILFGVAHKARRFNLENKIVLGTFPAWQEPYGPVKVSEIREELLQLLPEHDYVVHDSMQAIEHSVEAIVPFLQKQNPDIQIVSILVPYMSFERMQEISRSLARALKQIAEKHHWQWGRDFALVMSTDAVHYGDADWGGKNYAPYGTDAAGTAQVVAHEWEIINNCLKGTLKTDKIKRFSDYTVSENDFRRYKWTWCGRYSVPFGLLTANALAHLNDETLSGEVVGYANSINQHHVPVKDLKMGITAPANMNHWVGYAAVGYR